MKDLVNKRYVDREISEISEIDTRLTDVETTSNCSSNLNHYYSIYSVCRSSYLLCKKWCCIYFDGFKAPVAQTLGTSKYSLFTGIPTPSATAQIPAVVFTNNIVPIRLSIDVNGTVYWHYNPINYSCK